MQGEPQPDERQRYCIEVERDGRLSTCEIVVFPFRDSWTITAYGPEGEPIKFFLDPAGFASATDNASTLLEALEKGKQYVSEYLRDSRWRITGKQWQERSR